MEASAVSGFLGVALEGVAKGFVGVATGLDGVAAVEAVAVNALFTDVVGDGGGAGGEDAVDDDDDDEVSVDLEQTWPHGLVVACTEVEGFEFVEAAVGAGLTAFFMADST